MILETGDRRDSEAQTDHLAREARLVPRVTRVDLDLLDLKALVETSDCQVFRVLPGCLVRSCTLLSTHLRFSLLHSPKRSNKGGSVLGRSTFQPNGLDKIL